MTDSKRERIDELLADRALWGLGTDEQREFETLLQDLALREDEAVTAWESSAGLVTGALLVDKEDELPDELARALEADAVRIFLERQELTLDDVSRAMESDRSAGDATTAEEPPTTFPWRSWLVAAAAILLCGVLAVDRLQRSQGTAPRNARTALLGSAPDLLRVNWAEGPSDRRGEPSGDVAWSDSAQAGFMEFSGLPANDPNDFQYQLWIFDQRRDAAKPVDGGVFDIPRGSGSVVVPIQAKLEVHEAFGFAVTIEKAGGVVVSDRKDVVVTAGL